MEGHDRVALVTGGGRGIGRAVVERLRADGWLVETAELSSGVDLADADAAREAVEGLDRVDALVCNAGSVAPPNPRRSPPPSPGCSRRTPGT